MPIRFHHDESAEILRAEMSSPTTLQEFEDALERITGEQEFPPGIDTLWDLRGLDFREIDRGFLDRVIAVRSRFPDRGDARLAFVVGDDLAFGMSRMYEMLSGDLPQRIRVFREQTAAEIWLTAGKGGGG